MTNTTSTKTPHVHASLITQWAMGEIIEGWDKSTKQWVEIQSPLWGIDSIYRVKPKTTVINGYTVPMAIDYRLKFGDVYFVEMLSYEDLYAEKVFMETEIEEVWMNRKIMHLTKEAAVASAKARLGINPTNGKPVEKKTKNTDERVVALG